MHNVKSFVDRVEDVRDRTADSLESAADSVRAAGDESAGTITGLANDAGEKLDSTADYVRAFAGGDLLGDLRLNVRRNPVRSLALAAAIGLVAGFAWRASGHRA
jgi:ElaB/YqjD/DUF883 family membrane-anchored ribosome-binding protein